MAQPAPAARRRAQDHVSRAFYGLSVPVIRLGVLLAARVGADAGADAITVVPVVTTNEIGMGVYCGQ